MKLQSTYGKMKSESSNKALTVESNSNAIEGTSVVKIKSQAKAGYITGAKLPEIDKDGEKEKVDNGRYFIKTSAFFTQEQVERIEK